MRGVGLLYVGMVALGVVATAASPAGATVYLSTAEALDLAFPGCVIERQTRFLSDAEHAAAARLAAEVGDSRLVHPYRAVCDGQPGGTAYFDTHRVRTLPETVMVAVDPAGKVLRVEVLSFQEPQEYSAPPPFRAQFVGRSLDEPLALKRDLRGITGATLTSRAIAESARRVLAIHRALFPDGPAATDR